MAYKVAYDEKDGIVCVTYEGSVIKDDHYSAFDAALQLCKEHACSKLLVDFRNVNVSRLSTLESFIFARAVAETPTYLMIAHVLPMHDKANQNIHFASNVEANRGKTTGEFQTIEEARNWLIAGG